ncbi:MAG: cysteine synthase A [Clostridiales bacterium]|nr:cysteine synthase A [Clostridiales bacterium]
MIYKSILELIGKTPMVRLSNIEKRLGIDAELIAKVEYFNPASSVKDRAAYKIITDAISDGRLREGAPIIEATSGSMGIALAYISRLLGHRCIIVMPESMSIERRRLIKAYGAELILTPAAEGMSGAVEKAKKLAEEIPGAFQALQFDNPSNKMAHEETTAPEILADCPEFDYFVAGVGTGGTFSGCAKYFKKNIPGAKMIAVEPFESPVLSGGKANAHPIQGIGANFIPNNADTSLIDEIIGVRGDDAKEMAQLCVDAEGLLVGISSGAALSAAIELAKRPGNKGKRIVMIFPDTGERYLA